MTRLLAVAATLALTGSGASARPVLVGTVGPGFTITLGSARGKPVTAVRRGRYEIVVHDRSSFLDFHLFGPGVDKRTTVVGTATVHWLVTLEPGVYRYRCDAHQDIVAGVLRVR